MTSDGAVLLEVPPTHDGDRLDVLLAASLRVSRTQAAARIDRGEVEVDGRPATRRLRVRAGQRVSVAAPPAEPTVPPPPLPPVRYEDDHLLVLAKPAGLVVHPGAGRASGTLVDALRASDVPLAAAGGPQRPGIVHRLDRDTSGLLLVAKSDVVHGQLVDALSRRLVERRYLALVAGVPTARRGRIEAPLGRDPSRRARFAVVEGGKDAVTRYATWASGRTPSEGAVAPGGSAVSLLACELETGRTHQIRVHLSALGHPIVGDDTYGAAAGLARAAGLSRPFLHAAALRCVHPVTGATLDLREPLPDELLDALARCGIAPPDLDRL